MPSISTNAPQLAATFRRYAALTHHNASREELLLKQSLQLVIGSKGYPGLIQLTKEAAPSKGEIAADVKKQGWKIPTFFKDGRWGRGYPAQWINNAVAALSKKRGRKTKGRLAQEAAIKAKRPTLAQMQASVIKWRFAHRFFVAAGWLKPAQALGGSPNSESFPPAAGRIEISGDSVTIINDQPGIIAVNKKHGVARAAILYRILDMRAYIAAKLSPRGMKRAA